MSNAENLNYGMTGAKRSSYRSGWRRSVSLIMEANPTAGVQEVGRIFKACMTEEDIESMVDWAVPAEFNRLTEEQRTERTEKRLDRVEPIRRAAQQRIDRDARRIDRDAKTAEKFRECMVATLTLATIMPDGRTLGEWTFGEMGKLGARYAKLAGMGKANKHIGDLLTDQQLATL